MCRFLSDHSAVAAVDVPFRILLNVQMRRKTLPPSEGLKALASICHQGLIIAFQVISLNYVSDNLCF